MSSRMKSTILWQLTCLASVSLFATSSGCSHLSTGGFHCDIPAIPAHRVPAEFLGRPRADMQQISISRLRQNPPEVYQLGPGDILGIFIEFVLGEEGEAPPVHFPEEGDQPPALGYPVPIREDGTLALPLIEPVPVEGLTLAQATEAIRLAYIDAKILQKGQDKIIVTMLRRRMYRVLVIREETGGKENVTKRGTGKTIDLPAYENDVLHALNETGGMPGLDARNEILVIRGGYEDGVEWDTIVSQLKSMRQPCEAPVPIPDAPNITRIPIRFHPEQVPVFSEEDITLNSGDIIYIPARDNDRYYTGGVLKGGERLLPRDYDLDVLGAISVAGGPVGAAQSGIGQALGGGQGGVFGGGGAGGGAIPPSKLIVLRKLPDGTQVPIEVDVNRALADPGHRILVQPEDTLILKYRLHEEVINGLLNLVQFNFLFNGFQGGGF